MNSYHNSHLTVSYSGKKKNLTKQFLTYYLSEETPLQDGHRRDKQGCTDKQHG